jgi:hypothetical protein
MIWRYHAEPVYMWLPGSLVGLFFLTIFLIALINSQKKLASTSQEKS